MDISKYNLVINSSFNEYKFDNATNNSIFKIMTENMTEDTIWLVLNTKPNNNTDFITINLNSNTTVYLFPSSSDNVSFKIGELIQTVDNNAIFIITNHVNFNLFELKLIQCRNGASYQLFNNIPSFLYNEQLEKKQFLLNNNKTKITNQWNNYTTILNNTNLLGNFLSDNLNCTTDYTTDFTISFDFNLNNTYLSIINIIDKFHLNLQVYDYNDFKYIYKRDLIEEVNSNNYTLTSSNNLIGILKTSNTKILPHKVFKLKKENTYLFNDNILNKYTSYSKSYTGDKILVILQLSLKNKETVYDLSNNIESDSIFIIL